MTLFWTDRGLMAGYGKGASKPILVFMTDRQIADPLDIVRSLPRSAWVILRQMPGTGISPQIIFLRRFCRIHGLKFLVSNDRSLAVKLNADGLHLPERTARHGCLAPYLLWRKAKLGRLLTVAAHSRPALDRAARLGVSAALLSPIYTTTSHPGTKGLGAARCRVWSRESRVPVIALGGVKKSTIRQLDGAVLLGVAAISAFQASVR